MKSKNQNGLYVAFDIGTVSIKAAVLEVNDNGQRLAAIEEEALKPVSAFPGEDEHRQQVIEALKNIASRLPLNQVRSVSALFANRELQVKIIELPNMVQNDQVGKILNWEAKKLLSPNFREEPYAFSYRIIRSNPFVVALAVIPQRLLEKFAETFEAAGIKIDGAYGEVFAAQALKDIIDISGAPALSIVNLGQTGTHLQIFSAGELKFYRYIPSGMSEMSIPPKTNELEMYSQKIRFSFDYFRAVSKLNQIDCIYFMGGGAAQPDILPFERSYFSPSRINIVDISSGVDISPMLPDLGDNSPAEEKQRRLLPFIPSIGTILAGLSKESNETNLYAQLKNSKREKRFQELARLLPLWLGLAGVLIVSIILISMKSSFNSELSEIQTQLNSARMNNEAINIKIAKYKAATDTGIKLSPAARKTLEPIIKSKTGIARALFMVFQNRPDGLKFEEILIRSEQESENFVLEDRQETSSPDQTSGVEDNPMAAFQSRFDNGANDNEQLREGLIGKILIIRGICNNHEEISQFSENLVKKKLLSRLKLLQSRRKNPTSLEFLLKGEMP